MMNSNPQRNAFGWLRFGASHLGRLACAAALICIANEPYAADSAAPQGTPDFVLERQVVAAGGGRMDGGDFRVVGTIGQVDADPLHPASGGEYRVVGGFWATSIESPPLEDAMFRDRFEGQR